MSSQEIDEKKEHKETNQGKKILNSLKYEYFREFIPLHIQDETITVFDFGCGWATDTFKFFTLFGKERVNYFGIDKNHWYIKQSKEKNPLYASSFFECDFLYPETWPSAMQEKKGNVHVINCQLAAFHSCKNSIDLYEFLKLCAEYLHPTQGVLLFSCVDIDFMMSRLFPFIEGQAKNEGKHGQAYFSPKNVMEWVQINPTIVYRNDVNDPIAAQDPLSVSVSSEFIIHMLNQNKQEQKKYIEQNNYPIPLNDLLDMPDQPEFTFTHSATSWFTDHCFTSCQFQSILSHVPSLDIQLDQNAFDFMNALRSERKYFLPKPCQIEQAEILKFFRFLVLTRKTNA